MFDGCDHGKPLDEPLFLLLAFELPVAQQALEHELDVTDIGPVVHALGGEVVLD